MYRAQKLHKISIYRQEILEINTFIKMEKKYNAKEFTIFIQATCLEMDMESAFEKLLKALKDDIFNKIFGHSINSI